MAMPSRKRILTISFLVFLAAFFTAVIWYLYPVMFGETTFDEQGNPIRVVNPFPFGSGGANGGGANEGTEGTDGDEFGTNQNQANRGRLPRLREISTGPVIAAHMFAADGHTGLSGAATTTTTDRNIQNNIRYVELGSGHVYEGTTMEEDIERISNTTIPRIIEAQFINPDQILMRYTDEFDRIKTFSAELVTNFAEATGVPKKLQGIFLTDGLTAVDSSQDGRLIYLQPLQSGINNTAVITSDILGGDRAQVFASPLTEWNLGWSNANDTALLSGKPSYNTFNSVYTLGTKTGDLAPYTPARLALGVVTSDDLDSALLSMKIDGATRLYSWNRDSNQYIDLGLSTFAEKCVWAENRARFYCAIPVGTIAEVEPDLWYQGVTQYSDEYWEIDPKTGRSTLLLLPIEYTEKTIDTVDLTITADEQFLYFRDKVARSLWSIQIDYERTQAQQDAAEIIEGESGTAEDFFE